MRHFISMILLSAGIVLSLAGCQKGTTPVEPTGKAVKFEATSGSIGTRTSFTGDGTETTATTKTDDFGRKILTHERINWTVGDQVMIASDFATIPNTTTKFSTYTVESMTEDGEKSHATVAEEDNSTELHFVDDQTSYKFWGIYPATAGTGTSLVNAQAAYTVDASQAPSGAAVTTNHTVKGNAVTLTTLAPDMTKAVMLAAAENQTVSKVELEFYPGFTAFEFTLNSRDTEIGLTSMDLLTAEGKSLAGNVSVEIKTAGNSTYTCTYPTDKKVTYTFPASTVISPTKYLTFTVFALPEDITGLTLVFHMADGTTTTAKLMNKATDTKPASPITFAGCMKHCLKGIAVPGGWKFLWLDIDVMEWEEVSLVETNGNGVQATQFAVDGADNLRELKDDAIPSTTDEDEAKEMKNANKDYRQCWVFAPNTTVTVTYKIMMPTSGTWGIEALGDTGSFSVDVTSSAGTVTSDGDTFSGSLAPGATYITITITSTATTLKKLYFKTTASDGTSTFSLDSETQLYDMRGYHYFIVNGTADTTFSDLKL